MSDDVFKFVIETKPVFDFPLGTYKPEFDGVILGVNNRSYPSPRGPIPITAVLVAGSIGDYAVYIAATDVVEFCKTQGNKLSFQEACLHFPGAQLEEERYRT